MSEANTISDRRAPGWYRFAVGEVTAVAVHDGVLTFDRPPGFIRNAPDDAVSDAFAAAGMDRDKATLTFTALALERPDGVVLIDTGFGPNGPPGTGKLSANLEAAGIEPADVRHVLISHFHADHILGLRRGDGSPTFPQARIHVPRPEWAFWTDDARKAAATPAQAGNFEAVESVFGPERDTIALFDWGDEVLPGITAIEAAGHTPGMTAFRIVSGSAGVFYVADLTNNPLLFARHPDWQLMFDMDPEQATTRRRTLLDAASRDKERLFFFHAPFPGLGHVVALGSGYEYLPALWTSQT